MSAIVVGGSSGMGKAAAVEVARRGGNVLLCGRDEGRLAQAKTEVEAGAGSDGGPVMVATVDVTCDASMQKLFAERVSPDAYDALIFTAASKAPHGAFLDLPPETTRAFLESKLWGAFRCARAAAPLLKEGGVIVVTTGVLGRRPGLNCTPLALANGALEALVRNLALELGPRLRVNAFSPGFVATERFDHMDPARRDAMLASTAASLPLQRVGQPADAGEALYFLASNGYATGITLDCDGGHLIRQYASAAGDPMRTEK